MMLLGEIVVEVAMIAAVVVAVGALLHLLQLSVREQVYLRRQRLTRRAAESALVTLPAPQAPRTVRLRLRPEQGVLREKHV